MSGSFKTHGLLGIAAIVMGASAPAADAPQVVGIAAALAGDVRIGSASAPRLHAAALRERVALADRIETGQRSQLQILLLDRSTFSIGANARLTIDRFVYDPDHRRDLGARAARGAFRFMSGRFAPRREATIDTPTASIGIRGTILDGVVGRDAQAVALGEPSVRIAMVQAGQKPSSYGAPDDATLVVLRGPGAGTQAHLTPGLATVSTQGRTYPLDRPALALFMPGGDAAPVGPFAISRQGLQRMDDLIQPVLAQWRQQHSGRRGSGIGGLLNWLPVIIDVGQEGMDSGAMDQPMDRPSTRN